MKTQTDIKSTEQKWVQEMSLMIEEFGKQFSSFNHPAFTSFLNQMKQLMEITVSYQRKCHSLQEENKELKSILENQVSDYSEQNQDVPFIPLYEIILKAKNLIFENAYKELETLTKQSIGYHENDLICLINALRNKINKHQLGQRTIRDEDKTFVSKYMEMTNYQKKSISVLEVSNLLERTVSSVHNIDFMARSEKETKQNGNYSLETQRTPLNIVHSQFQEIEIRINNLEKQNFEILNLLKKDIKKKNNSKNTKQVS